MRGRAKSAKTTASSFEKKFETHQLYKRNKRYINLEKTEATDQEFSILRRKPIGMETKSSLTHKMNTSFMNSTAELTERLDRDIGKHKSRATMSARGPPRDIIL